MPERVVDFLETVEIEVEERDQLLVSARASECLLEPVAEEIAVGQAGKAVVLRRAFQLRPALGKVGLRALALGHVGVRADQAHGAAVAMVARGDLPVTLDPDPSTVALPDAMLDAVIGRRPLERIADQRVELGGVLRMHQLSERGERGTSGGGFPAQHDRPPIAQENFAGRDVPVEQRELRALQREAQLLFAFAQHPVGMLERGDVAREYEESRDAAVAAHIRNVTRVDVPLRPGQRGRQLEAGLLA